MRNIMAAPAEAEYGTIFVNTQTAVPIRTTMIEMGWEQGNTAIQVDNSTSVGIETKVSTKRNQRQWIWDSIGSTAESNKDNFESSEDQAQKTWGIIIPNIIQLNIKFLFDPNIYIWLN